MVGCDVATDGTAFARVAGVRWCQRHCQDLAGDLGNHEPVGRWFGGVEQGIAGPDVTDVVQTQVGMLEEMTGLPVNLERPVVIQPIDVEPLHSNIVLQTLTNDYRRPAEGSPCGRRATCLHQCWRPRSKGER